MIFDRPDYDCGVNTAPKNGPWEFYMVTHAVWREAQGDKETHFLCIECLELRLGRLLTSSDFSNVPLNYINSDQNSDRLNDRLGEKFKNENNYLSCCLRDVPLQNE